jgi:hypothetical protein
MAIKLKPGRQEVITARVTWTFGTGADVSAQAAYPAIQLPQGAVVLGGHLYVSGATSASATVAIGDTGVTNRYLGATSVAGTGLTALVPTGYVTPAQSTIDVLLGGATAAAAGTAELIVRYIRINRAEFTQG